MNLHESKRLYGLIGFPLTHSFSQNFFNQKFEAEHIDAYYENFEIPRIEALVDVLLSHPRLCGFNVTIPYKEKIFEYLDAVDPDAKAIGAVNVVKIFRQPDGSLSLKGYNSDCPAFTDTLRPMLDPAVHTKALVLGSGGAAKSVVHSLRSLGVVPQIVSREEKPGAITYGALTPEIVAEHKVIVNTTPLGMYPRVDECPPIPYAGITAEHICYDLLYNPDVTLFMKKAAEHGARVKNGLEMLLLQAFISWNIWRV